MSKTLGNGIDPNDIIEEYGADILRFSLLSGTTMGNDIKYMPEKLEQASNFSNKIWNAAKFIKMNLAKEDEIIKFHKENFNEETKQYNDGALRTEDKWMINKLNKLIAGITRNIEEYDLGIAIDKLYNFIWSEFCDWYIEMAKVRLYNGNENDKLQVSYVLDYTFRNLLKLLHPFMPFVTTKIYRNLVKYDDIDLILTKWPETPEKLQFNKEEETVEKIKEIIVGIRNVRNNMNIHPTKKTKLILVTNKYEEELKQTEGILLKLGFGTEVIIQNSKTGIPEDAISVIADGIELYMPLEGLVDKKEELNRLEGEKAKLEAEVARAEKMLSNPGFVNKAPESKVNEEKEKLKKYKDMLLKVEENISKMK